MLVYLGVYVWGCLVLSSIPHIKFKQRKTSVIIGIMMVIVPIIIICAMRGNVGTDTQRIYYPYYLRYIKGDTAYFGKELGFYFFNSATSYLYDSYNGLLFCVATLLCILYVYSSARDKILKDNAVLVYTGLFCIFFAPSLNIMRQSIACAIFFLTYRFIFEGKFIRYLIAIIIATLFHTSAILLLPLYFVYQFIKGKNIGIKSTLVVFGCVVLIFVFPVLFEGMTKIQLFEKYTMNYSSLLNFTARWNKIIIRIPLYMVELFTFINGRKKFATEPKTQFYLIGIVLEVVSLIFGFYMEWAFRLSYYFSLSHILYCSQYVTTIQSKRSKQIMTCVFIACFLIYFFIGHIRLGYDQIVPYEMYRYD